MVVVPQQPSGSNPNGAETSQPLPEGCGVAKEERLGVRAGLCGRIRLT